MVADDLRMNRLVRGSVLGRRGADVRRKSEHILSTLCDQYDIATSRRY